MKRMTAILLPVLFFAALIFAALSFAPPAISAEGPVTDLKILPSRPELDYERLYELLNSLVDSNEMASFDHAVELYREKVEGAPFLVHLAEKALSKKDGALFKKIVKLIKDPVRLGGYEKKFLTLAVSSGDTGSVEILTSIGVDINTGDSNNFIAPVIESIMSEKIDVFKMLLDKGANVDVYYSGRTPLYYAVEKNSAEMVEMLLNKGADVERAEKNYFKPIGYALVKDNIEIIKMIAKKTRSIRIEDDYYKNPQIHRMINEFSDKATACLLESGIGGITFDADKYGTTPLMAAVRNNKKETALILASREVALFKPAGPDGRLSNDFHVRYTKTAEIELCDYLTLPENSDLLELIVKNDLDAAGLKKCGQNLMFSAITGGNTKAVELLSDKFNDVDWSENGISAADHALRKNRIEFNEFLMKFPDKKTVAETGAAKEAYRIKPMAGKKGGGKIDGNLFVETVRSGKIEDVRTLIKNGADVNCPDRGGSHAIYWAALRGNFDMVKLLVENGADTNAVNRHNDDPLLYTAIYENNTAIAKYLLDKGANPGSAMKSRKILHLAAERGYDELIEAIIKHGGNANERDGHYETALFEAAAKNNLKSAEKLIEMSAEVNIFNRAGETPLHIAASKGSIEMAELLIEKGAAINISGLNPPDGPHAVKRYSGSNLVETSFLIPKRDRAYAADDNFITPLIAAVISKQTLMIEFLIKKGADTDPVSQNRLAAIHYAIKTQQNDIFETLLKNKASTAVRTPDGLDLLQFAAMSDNLYALKKMKELGFDINAVSAGPDGATALHAAEKNGAMAASDYLRKNGADTGVKDSAGMTAAEIRTNRHRNAIDAFEKALNATGKEEFYRISENAGEAFGQMCRIACGCDRDPGPSAYTPKFLALPAVQKAVWLGMPGAVEAMIEREDDPVLKKNMDGLAFETAVLLKKRKLAEYLLLNFTPKLRAETVSRMCGNGWRDLLNEAVGKGAEIEAVDAGVNKDILYSDYDSFMLLAKRSGAININNRDCAVFLDKILAGREYSDSQCVELIELLAGKKYDLNFADPYSNTHLYKAVEERRGTAVTMAMIEHGADLNVTRHNIRLVEKAAENLDADLVRRLVKNGADIKSSRTITYAVTGFLYDTANHCKTPETADKRFEELLKTIAVLKELGADAKSEIQNADGSGLFERVFEWSASGNNGPGAKKAMEYKEKLIDMIAGEIE